jgi:hypothetical protein
MERQGRKVGAVLLSLGRRTGTTVHGTVATADSLSMCRDLAHADQIFFLTNTVLAPAVHGQKIQAAVRSYK